MKKKVKISLIRFYSLIILTVIGLIGSLVSCKTTKKDDGDNPLYGPRSITKTNNINIQKL